jgi:membrane protease YdiL (CAAX protease family)
MNRCELVPMVDGRPAPATYPQAMRILQLPLTRIVLAALFVAVPFAIVAALLNTFVVDKSLRRAGALLLAATVVAGYLGYVHLVEKRRATELSRSHATREIGFGLMIGALLCTATIGILWTLGIYQVQGSNGWSAMLATLPGFILAGFLEEVAIRGILFRIVEQSLGSWLALALSSVVFGLAHLLNPGASLLNAAAISVEAGLLLGAAYMLTRRLWLCIGIHIAWNFVQGGVFSAAVSGGATRGLLAARLVGPAWLSGGTFGAEASVVALAVCVAAGSALAIAAVRRGRVIEPFWTRGRARSDVSSILVGQAGES